MGLGCARCGSCCNPAFLAPDEAAKVDKARDYLAAGGEHEFTVDSIPFILDHWHELGRDEDGVRYECDQYDPATRSCTAHENRPQVCRGFPWYGDDPSPERAATLARGCSFLFEVPPTERGAHARPLIPITVKHR